MVVVLLGVAAALWLAAAGVVVAMFDVAVAIIANVKIVLAANLLLWSYSSYCHKNALSHSLQSVNTS